MHAQKMMEVGLQSVIN